MYIYCTRTGKPMIKYVLHLQSILHNTLYVLIMKDITDVKNVRRCRQFNISELQKRGGDATTQHNTQPIAEFIDPLGKS